MARVVNARFKLIGDTINTASRMMSTALPNSVQVSSKTYYSLLKFGVNDHIDAGNPNCTPHVGRRLADFHKGMHVCHSNPQRSHGIVQKIEGGKVQIFFPIEGKKHGYDETSLKTGKVITEHGELYCPYNFQRRDPITVKGKGCMQTYIVTSRKKVDTSKNPLPSPTTRAAKEGFDNCNPQEVVGLHSVPKKSEAVAVEAAAAPALSSPSASPNLQYLKTGSVPIPRQWSSSSSLLQRRKKGSEGDLQLDMSQCLVKTCM